MPQTRLAADAFGVLTISLVSLAIILGLICIYRLVYFQLQIGRRGHPQLSFFNGPWLTRISLILVSIWWGFGEIARLTLLKGSGRTFSSLSSQRTICKFYIVSNLGFAEPSMFLLFGFLLHASLQGRENGVLSPRWNRRTIGYGIFYSLPVFVAQLIVILISHRLVEDSHFRTKKLVGFFSSASISENFGVCTFPLLSTAALGLFEALLICYVTFLGTKILSLVINRGLRMRVYLLIFSVIVVLPLRVLLLGFSVLPRQGSNLFETVAFLAFLVLLASAAVCICMLVYFPVFDSLALGDPENAMMDEVPFDDYYSDGASLLSIRSCRDSGMNADGSSKCDSEASSLSRTGDETLSAADSAAMSFFPRSSFNFAVPQVPSDRSPITPIIPRK